MDKYDEIVKELNDLKTKFINEVHELNGRITSYVEIGDMKKYEYYRGMIDGIRRVIASVNDIIKKVGDKNE